MRFVAPLTLWSTSSTPKVSLQDVQQFVRPQKRPRSPATDALQVNARVAKIARRRSPEAAPRNDEEHQNQGVNVRRHLERLLRMFTAREAVGAVHTRKRPNSREPSPDADSHRDKRIRGRSPENLSQYALLAADRDPVLIPPFILQFISRGQRP